MKTKFRKNVITLRKNQNSLDCSRNSIIIKEKLLKMDRVKNSNTIMLYLDFNNEVKTDILLKELINLNKIVVAPITVKEDKKLLPYRIKNLDSDIKIGSYGIREPRKSTCSPVDIKEIDIVIVPGVAFDKNGFRLGYGGGFYDRFLKNLSPYAITIGLAFDIQLFDEIPKEEHDIQLDYIITEKRILNNFHKVD